MKHTNVFHFQLFKNLLTHFISLNYHQRATKLWTQFNNNNNNFFNFNCDQTLQKVEEEKTNLFN